MSAFPDFYDAYDDIGESSLDGALPWDTVRPVEYRAYHYSSSHAELNPPRKAEHLISTIFWGRLSAPGNLESGKKFLLMRWWSSRNANARKEEFEAENRGEPSGLPLEEWVEDEDIDEDSLASSDSEL